MKRREDILVKELANILKPKFKTIWTNKKPSSSPKFKSEMEKELGYIPILQPEIDLCFLTKDGYLLAIEVKLFDGLMTYKTPFYEGIGQALALHRYGFDAVGLWFLFFLSTSRKGMDRYGAEAWSFVRNDLNLPLDFTYISVENKNDRNEFNVIQYVDRQTGIHLLPIDHPNFMLTWKHRNPIMCFPVQKKMRKTLEWWLQIKI